MNMSTQCWYVVCFINERVVHVDHSYSGEERAHQSASNLFNFGKTIDGEILEFTRVVAISEGHTIAFDVRGNID
jgi:hypothetical protein